jgi:serine protease Do
LTFGQDYAYYEVERVSKMKKLVLIPIIALFMSGAGLVATVATYPVSVNGERLDVTVLNQNGTTYLPLKAVGQALGADVSWNGKGVEVQTVDVDKLKEACVLIVAVKDNGMMQGSGVYVDYDQILTAQHVIDGASRFGTIDEEFSSVIKQDEKLDAALLKPKGEVKPVKIGDSDEVMAGDKVIVISSPASEENVVTYSKVYEDTVADEILISSNGLSAGSSGGAVFNVKGELIGIACSIADKWCFVRPINDIRKAL